MIRLPGAILLSAITFATAAAQSTKEEATDACRSLGDRCRQAVVVTGGDGCECDIFFLERQEDSAANDWRCDGSCRGTVGRNGLIDATLKREGDGCTPCGIYALRRGLWPEADVETRFPMEIFDEGYVWVDDSSSEHYNTLLRGVAPEDYVHGERLAAVGEPYDYIVVVEYNTQPVEAGAGSAIFLHVWRGEGRPTAGCVAMPRDEMQRLVGWLDPDCEPMIVITKRRQR